MRALFEPTATPFAIADYRPREAIFLQGDPCDCDERCPGRCALPDLPQEIVAEMVGTTRSRANAFLGKFKKLGLIEEHSGILHVNPARLHDVHDGDRRISIAASAAIPQAPELEETRWPLVG